MKAIRVDALLLYIEHMESIQCERADSRTILDKLIKYCKNSKEDRINDIDTYHLWNGTRDVDDNKGDR